MAWFEACYNDPLWRKMLANFFVVLQGIVEIVLPCFLAIALVVFLLAFLCCAIAVACGWDPDSRKKAQREELAGELAERAEGKAATATGTGTGCSEKRDELETVKTEMESLQEMLRERMGKLVSLATREKGE
jgi:hypothetical protein